MSGYGRKTNPFQFLQQVRAEAVKIVWPSRRETGVSTVMVLAMAFLAAIFFLVADQIISRSIAFLVERSFLCILAATGRGQRCKVVLVRLLEHVARAGSVARFHDRWICLPHSLPDAMALLILLKSARFFGGPLAEALA